ncbi:hypothetical protein [Streptomyces decoyicus]
MESLLEAGLEDFCGPVQRQSPDASSSVVSAVVQARLSAVDVLFG